MGKRSKRKTVTPSAHAQAAAERQGTDWSISFPNWVGVLAIIAIALWVYLPAIGGQWLWDDDWYITTNPLLRTTDGLWKFWFAPGAWVEYYPIEETLLWIEWQLFGNVPVGYHLVTLALHIISALLVWRLFARLGLGWAWLGGAIFAAHPVLVDSVAWIAETKNTASELPCLLAMIAWVDYENGRRPRDYFRALAFFVIAMLCKIAVAPLPFVLVLYAWWKRRRIAWADLTAAAPFLVIAVALSALTQFSGDTYASHPQHPPEPLPVLDVVSRLALSGQSLGVYFAHIFWPVDLLPNYPQWNIAAHSPLAWVPWLVLAAVLLVLWLKRASWGATALLGLGTFILFVFPFLGFDVTSYMAFTWIMDHFLYLAIIGPIGLFVAALGSIEARVPESWRVAVLGAAAIIVALLAFESHAYAAAFSDEASLWGYTVEHNPCDWLAHDNLGKAYFHLNKQEDAIAQFRTVLQLRPGRAQAHLMIGNSLVAMDRATDGIAEYDAALAINPTDPEIHNQKGVALLQLNRYADALAEFQEAVKLRPRYAIGLQNIGIALALSNHLDEAVTSFKASLEINPNDAFTHVYLGRALHQLGRDAEAQEQLREALQIDPDNPAAKAGLTPPTPSGS